MLQCFHISSHWKYLQHIHSAAVQDARILAWNWHCCQMPPRSRKCHLHCAILQKGYLMERLWQTPIWITLAPPFNQLASCHCCSVIILETALGHGPWQMAERNLLHAICHPCTGERLCKVRDQTISAETNCFEHACEHHHTFDKTHRAVRNFFSISVGRKGEAKFTAIHVDVIGASVSD